MKKILLFFLLLITLVINKSMIFAVEDTSSTVSEDQIIEIGNDVHDLLNKRALLWNELFCQQSNLEDINEELKRIVAPPLLTYDIEAFSEIKNGCTSMERILKVDVLKVKDVEIGEKEIIVDIEVEWLMEGFEKNYRENIDYRMNLIKSNEIWKISDYKVI